MKLGFGLGGSEALHEKVNTGEEKVWVRWGHSKLAELVTCLSLSSYSSNLASNDLANSKIQAPSSSSKDL